MLGTSAVALSLSLSLSRAETIKGGALLLPRQMLQVAVLASSGGSDPPGCARFVQDVAGKLLCAGAQEYGGVAMTADAAGTLPLLTQVA